MGSPRHIFIAYERQIRARRRPALHLPPHAPRAEMLCTSCFQFMRTEWFSSRITTYAQTELCSNVPAQEGAPVPPPCAPRPPCMYVCAIDAPSARLHCAFLARACRGVQWPSNQSMRVCVNRLPTTLPLYASLDESVGHPQHLGLGMQLELSAWCTDVRGRWPAAIVPRHRRPA